MPIFEYVCKNCGKEFEKLLPNATEHPTCPQCGENKKIVTAVPYIFEIVIFVLLFELALIVF